MLSRLLSNLINNKVPKYCSAMAYCALFVLIWLPINTYSQGNPTPQLIIKSFTVNNVEQKYTNNFHFKPDENNVQIIYEGVDLTFSGSVIYAYRLNNSKQWDTTFATTLTFPGLNSGAYKFSIKAKTESSNWSNIEIINFTIAKPIYLQNWFLLLVGGTLIISIGLFTYYRNKKYLDRERNALLQHQKMNEMENQAKQAMMNPHFVFNALNSIQHYMLENDKELANKYLTKFSRLIRMNLDLSIKSNVSLEEELEKLKLYLEIEQLRFGDKLMYDFEIDNKLETDIIQIPSLILQPFVENAIWHGIMPSHRNGQIRILAEGLAQDKILQIKVIDNGIGITNSKNLGKSKTHKSMGLQITTDRILLFGQRHKVTCKVTTEDNKDMPGTVVTIQIPLIMQETD